MVGEGVEARGDVHVGTGSAHHGEFVFVVEVRRAPHPGPVPASRGEGGSGMEDVGDAVGADGDEAVFHEGDEQHVACIEWEFGERLALPR